MLSAWTAPFRTKWAAAFLGAAYLLKFTALVLAFTSERRWLAGGALVLAAGSIAASVALCVAQMRADAAGLLEVT